MPLVIWIASVRSAVCDNSGRKIRYPEWGDLAALISVAMSLTVNALVTGLIVFKISKVYWEVKPLHGRTFGAVSSSKLRPVIFILIESGMALFVIQLTWLVVNSVKTQAALKTNQPIASICHMFNVIISSVIIVMILLMM